MHEADIRKASIHYFLASYYSLVLLHYSGGSIASSHACTVADHVFLIVDP